jgi:hypothetical protein
MLRIDGFEVHGLVDGVLDGVAAVPLAVQIEELTWFDLDLQARRKSGF